MHSEQEPINTSIDKTQERITYYFLNALSAGSKAQLMINFSGKLTGSMTGYYKSTWKENGKIKYYSLTQFEVC